MKKLALAVLATGLLSSVVVNASPAVDLSGYHGGFTGISIKSNTLFPATDISVINASDSTIKVSVPNSPVSDWVYTKASPYHITHTGGAFWTNILIQDLYYNTIFSSTVCPRALITVYGDRGHYMWNVDEEYCY